jgi:hypothetical protein
MRQTGVELLVDTVSEVPVPSDAQIPNLNASLTREPGDHCQRSVSDYFRAFTGNVVTTSCRLNVLGSWDLLYQRRL